VFLSYASQDAEFVQQLCEALRKAGIEVWFDQSELRGGDAWDASIRKQIKNCALFMPVISRNTHARDEGYFRLEWKLAVDRSQLMTANRPFLVPVVIDDTSDKGRAGPGSISRGAVDTPATGRELGRLCRECAPAFVAGAVTGTDWNRVGGHPRIRWADNPQARPGILAREDGAPRNDCRGCPRTRLPGSKSIFALEA
jgi:hypothetical protein